MDSLGGVPSAASTQQFCLRWHNHQSSLLSSLPLLLDQSLLTDVTLSAEGRTVRAHRVVLSACSSFFSDLFRTLEPPFHPVIVMPGASFGAMVALLTFMYSGEVNVFEEQIAGLLALAETLGIKGLADFNGNAAKSSSPPKCESPISKDADSPSPPPTPTPIQQAHHHQQMHHQQNNPSQHNPGGAQHQQSLSQNKSTAAAASPLETLFAKTFQFCPTMISNPLNFSPSAISRGAEIFARYQNQFRLNQMDKTMAEALDENGNRQGTPTNITDMTNEAQRKAAANATSTALRQSAAAVESMRKIDKIAENLRTATEASRLSGGGNMAGDPSKLAQTLSHTTPTSPMMLKPPLFPSLAQFMAENIQESSNSGNTTGNPNNNNLSSNNNNNNSSNTNSLNLSTNHSHNPIMHRPFGQTQPDCMMVDTAGSVHMHQQQQQQQHHHHQAQMLQQQQHHSIQHQQNAKPHQKMSPTTFHHQGSELSGGGSGASGSADGLLLTPEKSAPTKPSNSKLYATCFICHKQLSNQYNLRVHLETHQNVRYACEVCSHVSRSKDALRKHVSYRHPGAPSPCETEAKRKRTKAAAAAKHQQDLALLPSTSSYVAQQHQQMTLQQQLQSSGPIFPSSDPPSYPGPPSQPHHQSSTATMMGHQSTQMMNKDIGVKSEPNTATPMNIISSLAAGGQQTSFRDQKMHPVATGGVTPTSATPSSVDQHHQLNTESPTTSSSQSQHLNRPGAEQLPQC